MKCEARKYESKSREDDQFFFITEIRKPTEDPSIFAVFQLYGCPKCRTVRTI